VWGYEICVCVSGLVWIPCVCVCIYRVCVCACVNSMCVCVDITCVCIDMCVCVGGGGEGIHTVCVSTRARL
jgi:hypothetical protein